MKIFFGLAAVSLLLLLFWTFKLYFGFSASGWLPQANKSLENSKPASPKSTEKPVLVTNHPAGKSLSFAAVKNLLLTTNRQSLGGVGKIVTAKHGFYGYQIVRLPPTSFFYQLGARKGDIIRQLEAEELIDLNSDFKLYALLLRLPQVPKITVWLERDGKTKKFNFMNSDLKPNS